MLGKVLGCLALLLLSMATRGEEVRLNTINVTVLPNTVTPASWPKALDETDLLEMLSRPGGGNLFVPGSGASKGMDPWTNDPDAAIECLFTKMDLLGLKEYKATFTGLFQRKFGGPGRLREAPPIATWTVNAELDKYGVEITNGPECLCQGEKYDFDGKRINPDGPLGKPEWSVDNPDKLKIDKATGLLEFYSPATLTDNFTATVTLKDGDASTTKTFNCCVFKRFPETAKWKDISNTPNKLFAHASTISVRNVPSDSETEKFEERYGVEYLNIADQCDGRYGCEFRVESKIDIEVQLYRSLEMAQQLISPKATLKAIAVLEVIFLNDGITFEIKGASLSETHKWKSIPTTKSINIPISVVHFAGQPIDFSRIGSLRVEATCEAPIKSASLVDGTVIMPYTVNFGRKPLVEFLPNK